MVGLINKNNSEKPQKPNEKIEVPFTQAQNEQPEAKENRKKRAFLNKVKLFEEKTNLSIYLGTGLYQICVGLFFALLVSIIIGLPAILLYPYVTPLILWILKIIGWTLVVFGILICFAPFIRLKTAEGEKGRKILTIFLKISVILTFILIPIGIFLGLALKSELKKNDLREKKEKSMSGIYFFLLFVAGFIHLILGALLAIFLPMVIGEYFYLAYPYLNYDLINFLTILGWICLIPGAILIFCSFWSKKLGQINNAGTESKKLKMIRILIVGSSIFIVLNFPVGTFFGLTLIQEFRSPNQNQKVKT